MLGATRLGARRHVRRLGDGMAMGDTVIGAVGVERRSDAVEVRRDGRLRAERHLHARRDRRPAEPRGFDRAPFTSDRSSRRDSFYDPDPTTFARWKRLGHIGVEMEAAMMYTIAAVKGVEALAIMTVSDLLGESGDTVRISDEELKAGVDQMMHISCAVAVS